MVFLVGLGGEKPETGEPEPGCRGNPGRENASNGDPTNGNPAKREKRESGRTGTQDLPYSAAGAKGCFFLRRSKGPSARFSAGRFKLLDGGGRKALAMFVLRTMWIGKSSRTNIFVAIAMLVPMLVARLAALQMAMLVAVSLASLADSVADRFAKIRVFARGRRRGARGSGDPGNREFPGKQGFRKSGKPDFGKGANFGTGTNFGKGTNLWGGYEFLGFLVRVPVLARVRACDQICFYYFMGRAHAAEMRAD